MPVGRLGSAALDLSVAQQDQRTVRGFLREQRWEHCRTDLADATHAGRTVGDVRARWGFQDDAVFCRAFKKFYGISPGEYRKPRLQALWTSAESGSPAIAHRPPIVCT